MSDTRTAFDAWINPRTRGFPPLVDDRDNPSGGINLPTGSLTDIFIATNT